MKSVFLCFLSLLISLVASRPVHDILARADDDLPRLVIYFQTTHDANGNPISMLPLVTEKGIALTHLIVCSFHINLNSTIHLNDYPPGDPHFYTLWNETEVMKEAGVNVMGMIGGAAAGSFSTQTLDGDDATFEVYYAQLHDTITTFGLQGMDLDVEQDMSQAGITRLVDRLFTDFGTDFIITLAPVASALDDSANLSGFDYKTLESAAGTAIDFYNAQFYNGFGSMETTSAFDAVVANGWSPQKVVAGQITNPDSGSQYVTFPDLNNTIIQLREEYGQIGGIMGWEYFNSEPGGTAEPWEWAQEMTAILRPDDAVTLHITQDRAELLQIAWISSAITENSALSAEGAQAKPNIDYMALVNA